MSKRKHKFILLLIGIGSYIAVVFILSFHLVHRNYYDSNGTETVNIEGSTYKIIRYKPKIHWCQQLKFIRNTTNRPVVALVSFAGSGNTWLRYLLQQATGSTYKDYSLLWNGMHGESVANNSVSVIKTHEWGPSVRENFDKAVLLIRSPGSAIQAEFNRRSGGHLGFASYDQYTRNNGKEWKDFLLDKVEAWRNMNLDWIRNFKKPLLPVFYENLKTQTKESVESIIKFLQLPVDIKNLQCMMRYKEGIYRRHKPFIPLPFNLFPPEIKMILDNKEKIVYDELKKRRSQQAIIDFNE